VEELPLRKQSKQRQLKYSTKQLRKSKDLHPCHFWAPPIGAGGLILGERGRIRPGGTTHVYPVFATTWEEAAEKLEVLMEERDSIVRRRLLEETEKILMSGEFQDEWDAFIVSVDGDKESSATRSKRLKQKTTVRRLENFYAEWGLHEMAGWWPAVAYTPYSMRRHQIYRCESCARRHYSQEGWPFDLDALNKKVKCCERPLLKPLKARLEVEVYLDISAEEWEAMREQIVYSGGSLILGKDKYGKPIRQRLPLWSEEDFGHRIPPATWKQKGVYMQFARERYAELTGILRVMKEGGRLPHPWEEGIKLDIKDAADVGLGCPEKFDPSLPVSTYAYALVRRDLSKAFDVRVEEDTLKGWLYR
jgi:hypothetical protein